MKPYTFSLTKRETMEFCIRAVWEQQRRRLWPWIVIVLIIMLEMLYKPWMSLSLLGIILMSLALVILQNYFAVKPAFTEKERRIWLENGMLRTDAGEYGEIPCISITVVKRSRHLLMLGHFRSKRQIAWWPLPLRVFADQREREWFLEQLRQPQPVQEQGNAEDEMRRQQEAIFTFSFPVDQEKWVQILAGAGELISAGTLGRSGENRIALAFYGIMVLFLIGFWGFLTGGEFFAMLFFLLGLCLLVLLKVKNENPEKKVRRQLRSGMIQNDIYGTWEVSVWEDGISQSVPGSLKSFWPWEMQGWLVETERIFYLFLKSKRGFLMIPKEAMESREQATAFERLCREKGVAVVGGKKRKYVPGWIFTVCLCALIFGYLAVCVWMGFRDGRQKASEAPQDAAVVQEEWMQEFDPADYPDYVPLDEQVENLRALGFTVPDALVESVRDGMQESGMRAYVEGYPYTWLLSELGMPRYDENWEIIGYSEEVFWFDFEGWDIGTDYVEVLEGMRALAEGSPLDSVENIREDTAHVNWEEGDGTVTVLLEWKGQEYSWPMDVEDDWIDGEVLGVFNCLLEQEKTAERFYATGDDGQGALVFFGTAEWAENFEKTTGMPLNFYVAGKAAGAKGAITLMDWQEKRSGLTYCCKSVILIRKFRSRADACRQV